MKSIKNIWKNKNIKLFLAVFLFVFCFLLFANVVFAQYEPIDVPTDYIRDPENVAAGIQGKILGAIGWVVYGILWTIGMLFTFLTDNLLIVAQWNKFINILTVEIGWKIVRDLCNMFFILILLVIAFATILRVESYNAKRLLPKLLIMAVLINFSKMICGYIIDFSQVIMLTFLSVLDTESKNQLPILLGIDKIMMLSEKASAANVEVSSLTVLGALLAGMLVGIVAFVVVLVIFIMLVFRIVMLWVYVILSPIAFLTAAFPAGQKYSSQWWGEFIKQVITGPILAFFLYLALSTLNDTMNALGSANNSIGSDFVSKLPADFWEQTTFQTYIITLALLVGGLIVTQQAGGIAGSIAGKGLGALNKGRAFALGGMGGLAYKYSGAKRVKNLFSGVMAERKSRIEMADQRKYAADKARITAPIAAAGALREMAADRVRSVMPPRPSMDMFRSDEQIKQRRMEKERKEGAKMHMAEAYRELKSSQKGAEFKKEGYTYERTEGGIKVKDANGDIMNKNMTKLEYDSKFARKMSAANQMKNQIDTDIVNKEKSKIEDLSTSEIKNISESSSVSKYQKMAASMIVAGRGEFGNEKELQSMKTNIEKIPTLLKQFNDAADKSHGVWNNTEEGFKAKVSDGTINVERLDVSQINNGVLDIIRDTVGPAKYAKTLEGMGRTKNDADAIKIASQNRVAEFNKNNDYTDNAMLHRLFNARNSGNFIESMDTVSAYHQNDKALEETGKAISAAKGMHLAKLKEFNFDVDKAKDYYKDQISAGTMKEEDIEKSVNAFKKQFQTNINVAQLDDARKSGEANTEQMKTIVRTAYESGRKDLQEAIEKNANLKALLSEEQLAAKNNKNTKPNDPNDIGGVPV